MADRKTFADSIVPLPTDGTDMAHGLIVNAAESFHMEEPFKVHFSYGLDDKLQADLEKAVASGTVIPAAQIAQRVAQAQPDTTKLQQWLSGNGYTIDHMAPNGIYATADAGTVASTLGVDMVRVTRDGFTHNAARTAPSLPSDVAEGVTAIGGLQPFLRAHRHSRSRAPVAANRAGLAPMADADAAAAPQNDFAPPYMVSEILKAYDATGVGATGNGQTIAILIDTFPTDSDITAFWTQNGIAVDLSRIEKINVSGGTLPPPEGEETLDVAWTSGIAPRAKIRVYASGSLAFLALDRALDAIIADLPTHPGLRQLSISLGLGETYLGAPTGEVATQHGKYLQLAAAGVNVFVSTGDAGSNPDQSGHSSGGPTQAEYPSSDSAVVAVGGTTLRMNAGGGIASESGWASGGGGKSRFFAKPKWQKAKGSPTATKRMVPDVSLVADPDTGCFLILGGQVKQYGGTSWSAPVWAGFCALLNETRIIGGKPALPFINPLLYPLNGQAAFRDIVSGSNGLYEAHVGFDLVTGLGVPSFATLAAKLL